MKMNKILLAVGTITALMFSTPVLASGGGAHLQHAEIDVSDQKQIQRGLMVFTDVCMGCHSAKYVTYRGLMAYPEIGLTRIEVD